MQTADALVQLIDRYRKLVRAALCRNDSEASRRLERRRLAIAGLLRACRAKAGVELDARAAWRDFEIEQPKRIRGDA
jgi:hypothetical protein